MDTIHLAHFLDGFPLCWGESQRDEDLPYQARYDEAKVTCLSCLTIIKEGDST